MTTEAARVMKIRTLLAETIGGLSEPAAALRAVARSTRTAVGLLESLDASARERVRDRLGELRREFQESVGRISAAGKWSAALVEYSDAVDLALSRSVEILIPTQSSDTTIVLAGIPSVVVDDPKAGEDINRLRGLPGRVAREKMTASGRRVLQLLDVGAAIEECLEQLLTGGMSDAKSQLLPLAQRMLDASESLRRELKKDQPVLDCVDGIRMLHEAAVRLLA